MNMNMNTKILKKTKGFTLIELIVVIAIIGILIGIAVPQYNKFIFEAKLAKQDADAKILYNAAIAAALTSEVPYDHATWYTNETNINLINELSGPNISIPEFGAEYVEADKWTINTSYPPYVVLMPPFNSPVRFIPGTGSIIYVNGEREIYSEWLDSILG